MNILVIKNKATITNLNNTQLDIIKDKLSLPNPKYIQVKQIGKSIWGIPKTLNFYMEHKDSLEVPVGFIPTLLDIIPISQSDIVDGRFEALPLKIFKFKGKLYPYQQKAVDSMIDKFRNMG